MFISAEQRHIENWRIVFYVISCATTKSGSVVIEFFKESLKTQ